MKNSLITNSMRHLNLTNSINGCWKDKLYELDAMYMYICIHICIYIYIYVCLIISQMK